MDGQRHAPAALHLMRTWYQLGGLQGRSGRLPPPGFDPRTVQPVASYYTKCAMPTPKRLHYRILIPCWLAKFTLFLYPANNVPSSHFCLPYTAPALVLCGQEHPMCRSSGGPACFLLISLLRDRVSRLTFGVILLRNFLG